MIITLTTEDPPEVIAVIQPPQELGLITIPGEQGPPGIQGPSGPTGPLGDLSDVEIDYDTIVDGQALIWDDTLDVWMPGEAGLVDSVNGQQGDVILTPGDVGADPSGAAAAVDANLTAHLSDTTDAHDASAVSVTPAGGIAASEVQSALEELDSEKAALAHTHPESDVVGLTTDLASKVPVTRQVNGHALSADVVVTKADVGLGNVTNDAQLKAADLDTDTTLAASSDTKISSQHAVKTYVDTAVTGLLEFKGSIDASANPNYPVASKGDAYVISVAGKVGGAAGKNVDVGDMVLAIADNAGGTEVAVGTSWSVLEHNLVGALLAVNNLSDVANTATARSNLNAVTAGVDVSQAGTIANDAVTTVKIINDAVTNVKLANMANGTLKGRSTAGTGDPEDLIPTQVLALLTLDVDLQTFALPPNTTISTFIKDLLDDADAAAARATIDAPKKTAAGGPYGSATAVPGITVNADGTLSFTSNSISGGLVTTTVKTAGYTAAVNELVLCDTNIAAFTVNLPNAPANNTQVGVALVNNGGTSNKVTVARSGTDVYNYIGSGVTSMELTSIGDTLVLEYRAGVWYILSQPGTGLIVQNDGVTIGERGIVNYEPSSTIGYDIVDDGTKISISSEVVKYGGINTWSHSFSQQDGAGGTLGMMDNYISHIAAALNVPTTEAKLRGRSGAQATSPSLGESPQIPGATPAGSAVRGATSNTTSGSPTVTDTGALATDIGREVSGPGIPPGAYVLSVVVSTSLTLSANARATQTGVPLRIGDQQGLGAPMRHMLPPHWFKRYGKAEARSSAEADPTLNIALLGINDPLRDWITAQTIGVNAFKHGLRTFSALRRLKQLYDSLDPTIVYGGSGAWTTVVAPSSLENKLRRNPTAGATFTITLPDSLRVNADGICEVVVFLYGQPNGSGLNYSVTAETRVDWSGTCSVATGNTVIGGQGNGNSGIQIVKRFACVASDRGKTIIGTLAGVTHADSLDVIGWGIEDTVPPAVILVNIIEQTGAGLANFASGATLTMFNDAFNTVAAEFDLSVAVADVKTPFSNRFNFVIQTAIAADVTFNHAGQTIVLTPANVTQNELAVGGILRFGISSPAEEMLVTAIDKTNAGANDGNWRLTVTRNYTGVDTGDAGTSFVVRNDVAACTTHNGSPTVDDPLADASLIDRAVTGSNIPANSYVVSVVAGVSFTMNNNATGPSTATGLTMTFGGPRHIVGELVVNMIWLSPDRIHPSPMGHRLLAAYILATIGALPQSSEQLAGAGGYSRSILPSIPDNGYIWAVGQHTTITTGVGPTNQRDLMQANRILVPEDVIALGVQWEISGAATGASVGRVGIYADQNGLPGDLVTEGDFTQALDGSTGVRIGPMFKPLRKGYYWLAYVPQGNAAVGTIRATHNLSQGMPYTATAAASPLLGNFFEINGCRIPGVSGALPNPFGNVAGQVIQWNTETTSTPFGATPCLVLQYTKWVQD